MSLIVYRYRLYRYKIKDGHESRSFDPAGAAGAAVSPGETPQGPCRRRDFQGDQDRARNPLSIARAPGTGRLALQRMGGDRPARGGTPTAPILLADRHRTKPGAG